MKRYLTVMAVACSALLSGAAPDPSWSIVLSGKGSAAEQHFDRMAARLLQKGLEHLTGHKLKTVTGGKVNGKAVFIGRHSDPVKPGGENWYGRFRTDSRGNWYFSGGYRAHKLYEKYNNHRFHASGTLRAVIMFLREYAGLRVPLPGTRYHTFTAKKTVAFPKNFSVEYHPAILYCHGHYTRDAIYDICNNFLSAPWYYSYGGHSHPIAVPVSLFSSHPEYFAMTPGMRRWRGLQFCISNPGFQELVYQEMCRKAALGYDWVQLGHSDGFFLCRCKDCRAYGNTGDAGEKLWIIHRNLAERFRKEHPGKKVVILCYHPNNRPPASFDSFPGNTIIELCNYRDSDLEAWKKFKVPGGLVSYVYNWGLYHAEGYSPKFPPSYAVEQMRKFKKAGIKGIYRCGSSELFGLEGPAYYAYGNAAADDTITAEQAVAEFCRTAFPQAPEVLKAFYDRLYRLIEEKKNPFDHAWHAINSGRMRGGYSNIRLYALRYTPEVVAELELLLKKVESAAKGDPLAGLLRAEFELLKHTAVMSDAYLKYLASPSEKNFRYLGDTVKRRKEYVFSLPCYRNGKVVPIGGIDLFYSATRNNILVGSGGWGRFVYPVQWPWQELLKYNINPLNRKFRCDGREHRLLPGLMDKWTLEGSVSFQKSAEGLTVNISGPGSMKNAVDFYYLYFPDYRLVFRSGGETGSRRPAGVYPYAPGHDPAKGEKYGKNYRDPEIKIYNKGKGAYTVFIPWKLLPCKTMPAAGTEMKINVTFRRQLKNGYQLLVSVPDLKYLSESKTWSAGRAVLIF